MLKNENVICISSIDWDFIWQGHQEIMSTFAATGNRVLFIENTGVRMPTLRDFPRLKKRIANWFRGIGGIRKERENLYVFSPLVVPFPYSHIARWINRHLLMYVLNRWMKAMDFNNPVIWTFLPTGLTLDLINDISKKATIYYCIDNFSVSSSLANKVRATEKKLIKQADLVFVTANELYKYCSQYSSKVYIFPFGVNIENFERVRSDAGPMIPDDLKAIKRPIIGYIGGVHKWIDLDLIKDLAQRHHEYSFVFIGPLQTDVSGLSDIKNIHFLGPKAHTQLPEYVNYFNVGIIPYLLTDYTRNVYPTKLNEYLALGKPVVSTNLLEVNTFNERHGNIVAVAKDTKGFADALEKAVSSEGGANILNKRVQIARENTWKNRIEQMSALIEAAIKTRQHDRDLMWKENLVKFYRMTRKRLIRLVVGVLLVYFVLFHTPFLWFMAKPLKITETPKPADVIVVFAGGVGESGKAGQGYEERVMYAIDLYNRGFADKIIFSSGFTYAIKEAEVMKAIAVSLDIPERNIKLEKNASNTLQNVVFTKRVMETNDWDSALVVSSPYHMRRLKLVYRKNAPEIEATLTPVPNSLFYGDEEEVALRHIRAIVHEYLGIIYYWWKGYI
ncbi:MAG: YdcF family protein [Candidatus Omnitrophica bacterium]|nr:YdcF family protein [Candidatus Omnitrophota bacterium]